MKMQLLAILRYQHEHAIHFPSVLVWGSALPQSHNHSQGYQSPLVTLIFLESCIYAFAIVRFLLALVLVTRTTAWGPVGRHHGPGNAGSLPRKFNNLVTFGDRPVLDANILTHRKLDFYPAIPMRTVLVTSHPTMAVLRQWALYFLKAPLLLAAV